LLAELAPQRGVPVEFARNLETAVSGADIAILCVSDDALASTTLAAGRAVAARGEKPVFLVCSGLQPLEPLRARLQRGISLGRLHPLAPVLRWSSKHTETLQCDPFGLEGDPRAQRAARSLLRHWDGSAVRLVPGKSVAYHAGASLLGGGVVALFALAEELMAPAVRSRSELREALEWFAKENLRNVGVLGPRQALTGPLARGSEAVVRAQLRALGRVPHARGSYAALGEVMLDLARERGSIDAATARGLRRVLRARSRKR
jgi:predicted short-subunit dehydrogenase-like oxidoreductase (DUF2520 family)